MAERSNATSKKNTDAADVVTLQKRGRRRLVGAIALVLLAVIILPMVFDPEPKPSAPTVSIRIPSEEGTPFTPKAVSKPVTPSTPAAATVAPEPPKVEKPVEKPVEPAPPPVAKAAPPTVEKPAAKPAEKPPSPKAVEKKVAAAPAAPAPAGEQFVVQIGAFSSAERVKEVTDQLKGARLAHYTESVATAKGPVTRVRMGPFASKAAAEKAQERAKALGLNPANPIAK